MKNTATLSLTILLILLSNGITQSQSLFDLKRQRIIIVPPIEHLDYDNVNCNWYRVNREIGCVYTLDAFHKMKFKKDYFYNQKISGDTITITDILHIDQGGKKESVLLLMNHKGNDVVYRIPLYFEDYDNRAFRDHLIGTNIYKKNTFKVSIENIDIVYYNVDSIKVMEDYFKNKEWWLVSHKGTEKEKIEHRYAPFKFLKFEINNNNSSDNLLEYLNFYNFTIKREGSSDRNYCDLQTFFAVFEASDGSIWKQEIKYKSKLPGFTYTKGKEMVLNELPQIFVSENEMRQRCELLFKQNEYSIERILNTFKNKSIYINSDKVPDNLIAHSYNITKNEIIYHSDLKEIGYLTLQNIKVLPIIKRRPFYAIYAIFNDEKTEYAIPFSESFFNYVEDAQSHRNKIAVQLAQEEKIRAEEERKDLEMQRKYKQNLIIKYGKSNAELILQGEIKLGFTRDMVQAAWGNPYDTSRIINHLGSVEMWMYGLGDSYVYFSKGVVVQIIE